MRADNFGEASPVDCHGETAEFQVAKLELVLSAAPCQPSLDLSGPVGDAGLRRVFGLVETRLSIRLRRPGRLLAIGLLGRHGGTTAVGLRRDDALLGLRSAGR